jgi:hypothetical protein
MDLIVMIKIFVLWEINVMKENALVWIHTAHSQEFLLIVPRRRFLLPAIVLWKISPNVNAFVYNHDEREYDDNCNGISTEEGALNFQYLLLRQKIRLML